MQDDAKEWNPGRADFWVHFYDDEEGRLRSKEQQNRKARELAERGSLMNHYEWFMEYTRYEKALLDGLRRMPTFHAEQHPVRVLHVGCGNSDFCDHVGSLLADHLAVPFSPPAEVLNVDICENIVTHLAAAFPDRLYAVGNCCDLNVSRMTSSPTVKQGSAGAGAEDAWYKVVDGGSLQLQAVRHSSVDLVFDKGTADALLSAFAGEFNPNMEAYIDEMLKVLRVGGVMFVISINSEDVVNPYFLSAQDGDKYFQLEFTAVIELDAAALRHLRVETLGSRYSCYGYAVVASSD